MKFNKLFLALILTLLFVNFVSSANIISSCGTISSSGDYILNQSIAGAGTCLTISANDVELDCGGHTIEYNTAGTTTRMGIDAISGTNTRTNLTIKNCVLIKPTNLQTAGYGIRLTRFSNSNLINNTIYTNGTTNNYGIYLTTDSQNNLIENNTIYSKGTSTGNSGIYLLSGSSNNTLRNNFIQTSGTTTSHGIWIVTNSHNNVLEKNIISTYGSTGTTTSSYGIYVNNLVNNTIVFENSINTTGNGGNYGIYLLTNVFKTNISKNTIYTNGTTANYGIAIAATTTAFANENHISENTIYTNGTSTANYGIYLYRNANKNILANNKISTGGTTTGHGIYLIGVSGGPVDNNQIYSNEIYASGTAVASTNYGILLATNTNSNNLSLNNISTLGSTGYGIHLLGTTMPTENNIIDSNIISTNGTGANNYGIYLFNRANYNNLTGNIISTYGTSTNHGIYLSGTTAASNYNQIVNNSVNSNGSLNSNYGVYLYRNINDNLIENNNISTEGTATNYGIYGVGTTTLSVNNNSISKNNIFTRGTTTNNYGVYFATNANGNNITGNNILINGGTTGNAAIVISGATFPSNDNEISRNIVKTSGTTTNHGIYFTTNTSRNIIQENSINATGTTTTYGIYLVASATSWAEYNNISRNNISTTCTASSSSCHGIYLQNNANYNNISENNISISGTATNYGIYLYGATTAKVNYNSINSNDVSSSGSGASNYGLYLNTNASENNVSDLNIITFGTTTNHGIAIATNSHLNTIQNVNVYANAGYGISITSSNYTVFEKINVTSSNNIGLYMTGSSHNYFKDGEFNSESIGNHISLVTNSLNNTLTNCTYNLAKESVASGSQLIRKWYYSAIVSGGSEEARSNVSIIGYDKNNNLQFNISTNSSGETEKVEIVDYLNNVTSRNYYSNYTIYVTKDRMSLNHEYNASLGNGVDEITLDSSAPIIYFNQNTDNVRVARDYIIVNISATDENLAIITIDLYNLTERIASFDHINSPFYYNFSGLSAGEYQINATACDSSSNCNSTETRNITINALPQINLISPFDKSGSGNNITIFSYNVSDDAGTSNCSLVVDDIVLNYSTEINSGTNYLSANINKGIKDWKIKCDDSDNQTSYSENRKLKVISMNKFISKTDLTEINLESVENLTLEDEKSKIKFIGSVNISDIEDIDSHIQIGKNYISIDSNALPQLNKTAELSLTDINLENPVIFRNGELCDDCEIISNVGNTIIFRVPHFTNYSVSENSQLAIFDTSDIKQMAEGEVVIFYANYTNSTSEYPITLASCELGIESQNIAMSFNALSGLFEVGYTPNAGITNYNISCDGSSQGFTNIILQDYTSVQVFSGPSGARVNATNSQRMNISLAGNNSAIAGNITELNLYTEVSSSVWQGYYGRVSGEIHLSDINGNRMYNWSSNNYGGRIYASRFIETNFATVKCALSSEITSEEENLNINNSSVESIENTFNNSEHQEFLVGNTRINENTCYSIRLPEYNNTGFFEEILLSDGASNIFYSTIVKPNSFAFNNFSVDFEMIVAVNGINGNTTTTPYYFWMEIQ